MILKAKKNSEDTKRISITAHYTGYTWYYHDLSPKLFTSLKGYFLYNYLHPLMLSLRWITGVTDLETLLIQRHLMIDHLLENAIKNGKIGQVIELASGLSPRGYRFTNNEEFKHIKYVETDLPDMIQYKKNKFKSYYKNENHLMVPCNILVENGEFSLDRVFTEYLDPNIGTAVITEGIINYFGRSDMDKLWKQISRLLNSHSGGIYLSDNMIDSKDHPYYHAVKFFININALVARGKMHLHFFSIEDAIDNFKSIDYKDVNIHDPESFYEFIPIPRSRKPGYISIIEALV